MAVPLHTIETGGGVCVVVAHYNKTYRVYIQSVYISGVASEVEPRTPTLRSVTGCMHA